MKNNSPKVSVVFACYNESERVTAICESIKNQTYKNIQIVPVVDAKTTDNSFEIAKKYSEDAIMGGLERSENRNMGIEKSDGEYILMLDCDMVLTEDVVKDCVDIIKKDKEIMTVVVPEKSIGTTFWSKCKAFERNFYFLEANPDIEAARFFKKSAILEVGGYDDNITGPEDWDLPDRINQKHPETGRTKAHIIHDEGNVSLKKLIQKKYYYALKTHVYLDKDSNNGKIISAKTIYFLRPTFYRNWQRWFKNPIIGLGTLVMLTSEFIAGAFGFVKGKYFMKENTGAETVKKIFKDTQVTK